MVNVTCMTSFQEGAGETVQQLRAHTPVKNSGSVRSTHIRQPAATVVPEALPPSGLLRDLHAPDTHKISTRIHTS